MPKPKQKRILLLQSSYSPTSLVADLNVTMDADFDTHSTVTTVNTFEDASATGDENTEYKLAFSTGPTAPVGTLTISLTSLADDLSPGISADKTATSSSTPTANVGTVTPISSPDYFYQRMWQQPVFERSDERLENVAGIDMRVKAESGYTVAQGVTSTDPNELVITYVFTDSNGLDLATGTVTLQAQAVAHGDYTLGDITVTDDPASVAREPGGGRKTLRERLRAAAKELRRLRKERSKDDRGHGGRGKHGH